MSRKTSARKAPILLFFLGFAAWSLALERRNILKDQLERVRGLAEVERQRARVGEGSGLSARRFTLAEAEARAALGGADGALAKAEALARSWRPDLAADAACPPPAMD